MELFYFLDKIPSPTRDEMMDMTVRALSKIKVDAEYAFKTLFVTNKLDGSEDHLVKDSIFRLVGAKMQEFRENLLKEPPPKDLNELLKTITPPKGIRRKNTEGSELHDCEGDELLEPVENEVIEDDEEGKYFDISIRL